MHMADYQAGTYFCEASFDLDEGLWVFKEIDAGYCDWKMQRSFPHQHDFLRFVRSHCPKEFSDAVIASFG